MCVCVYVCMCVCVYVCTFLPTVTCVVCVYVYVKEGTCVGEIHIILEFFTPKNTVFTSIHTDFCVCLPLSFSSFLLLFCLSSKVSGGSQFHGRHWTQLTVTQVVKFQRIFDRRSKKIGRSKNSFFKSRNYPRGVRRCLRKKLRTGTSWITLWNILVQAEPSYT